MRSLRKVRRMVAVSLLAVALTTGCVTEEPPTNSFVNDVQNDFETNDYFNP